ncbi:tRNA methyltransferase 10 -like protein B [Babesia sp. Xinjiang]|uniref:tRNA methyltransferase 10 -like protein B n=1 Tax=Babesia sp. Xinjiang TaxID=462227 RepID=UPI000A229C89|nr:tRNA methyltransferase 10 -like protein B [Babesia sp. Xinjiang]ORM41465.1 tRNA methyltransferase 10 -like protein B [Babesia sp. Xinjiang]
MQSVVRLNRNLQVSVTATTGASRQINYYQCTPNSTQGNIYEQYTETHNKGPCNVMMGDHTQRKSESQINDLDTLTRHMIHEVTDVFASNCIKPWETDKTKSNTIGTIKAEQFVHVARQLGCVFTAPETRAISRQLRKHNIQHINIDQFVQLINNKVKQDRIEIDHEPFVTPNEIISKKLEELYEVLDWQKQNKLTTADLKHFLGSLNDGELGQKGYIILGTQNTTQMIKETNCQDDVTSEQLTRLPRSKRKQIAKAKSRERRKERRRQKRQEHNTQQSMELQQFLAQMTEEEREQYFMEKRKRYEEWRAGQDAYVQQAHENGMPICVNFTFDDMMDEKESKSLARQLAQMYSWIKKKQAMVKLIFSGFKTDTTIYKHMQLYNVDNWKVHKHCEDYWDIFEKDKLVVLTPDAEEYMEEIEEGKVYVIGGLVDVNVKRNITLTQALQHDVTTRALPIKMFKRAYLYACTAPAPDDDDAHDADVTEKPVNDQTNRVKKAKRQSQNEQVKEPESKGEPQSGGKVKKCKLCKGKTLLNQEAVNKHLDSKEHKKRQKKFEKEEIEADNTRRRFLQRMESLQKKAEIEDDEYITDGNKSEDQYD